VSYIRYDVDAHQDPQLRLHSWQATLIWPHILTRLKKKRGVASDMDLDPRVLTREFNGVPEEIFVQGLDELVAVGLLVEATVQTRRGATAVERTGWTTPNMQNYYPDGRAHSSVRSQGLPGTPREEKVFSSSMEEERKNKNNARPTHSQGVPGNWSESADAVWSEYRKFHPRSKKFPSLSWVKLLVRSLKTWSGDDLKLLIRWAHESPDFSFQRRKGYDKLNNLLVVSKLEGRIEQAHAWTEAGGVTQYSDVHEHPALKAMAPADRLRVVRLSPPQARDWMGMVDTGVPGSVALLRVSRGAVTLAGG
jgi:hypothetical protein